MYILHCHTDYYGPQLVGAYSSIETMNQAVEAYSKAKPTWTKDLDGDMAFRVSGIAEFYYHEVELDGPVKEVK